MKQGISWGRGGGGGGGTMQPFPALLRERVRDRERNVHV
jgi:hypothetical protein